MKIIAKEKKIISKKSKEILIKKVDDNEILVFYTAKKGGTLNVKITDPFYKVFETIITDSDYNQVFDKIKIKKGLQKGKYILSKENSVEFNIHTVKPIVLGIVGYKNYYESHETFGNIDVYEKDGLNSLKVSGWIRDSLYDIKNIHLRISNEQQNELLEYPLMRRKREDVAKAFNNENLLWNGFDFSIKFKTNTNLKLDIIYYTLDKENVYHIGELEPNIENKDENSFEIEGVKYKSIEFEYNYNSFDSSVIKCMEFIKELSNNSILIFNHYYGGGASIYSKNMIKSLLEKNKDVYSIEYKPTVHQFELLNEKTSEKYYFDSINILINLMSFRISEIRINELVSYPNVKETIERILYIKKTNSHINLIFYVHDYFCVCPTINLLNYEKKYCGLPNVEDCEDCYSHLQCQESDSISSWRSEWGDLLAECDEIVCFSQSSYDIMLQIYGSLNKKKLSIIPHTINSLDIPNVKKDEHITIGLLGYLTYHKGEDIIKGLLDYIQLNNLTQYRILLIGKASSIEESDYFMETGIYSPNEIPKYVEKYNVDLFFMSSIWPETFSFTVSEIISMDMPLLCFDIGAQGERTKKYNKGFVIPLESTPSEIIKQCDNITKQIYK